jgi:(S)-ureidoglycine aminohydrolase
MKGSRGVRGASYTLITPANHYPSRLPEYGDAPVVKLVTPRLAPSRIGEHLVALPAGGGTTRPVTGGFETFLYGLEGGARIVIGEDAEADLGAGGYAYVPETVPYTIAAGDAPARVLIVKRRYEPAPGHPPPGPLTGHRGDEPFSATPVAGFRRRELLPTDDPAYDFAMSLLAFDAGVGLDNIEIHDEEHGLYMTAGAGLYFLDGDLHEVQRGDFIYMAPYCPQGFTATGREPAEYLLYKDTWRDGF